MLAGQIDGGMTPRQVALDIDMLNDAIVDHQRPFQSMHVPQNDGGRQDKWL